MKWGHNQIYKLEVELSLLCKSGSSSRLTGGKEKFKISNWQENFLNKLTFFLAFLLLGFSSIAQIEVTIIWNTY